MQEKNIYATKGETQQAGLGILLIVTRTWTFLTSKRAFSVLRRKKNQSEKNLLIMTSLSQIGKESYQKNKYILIQRSRFTWPWKNSSKCKNDTVAKKKATFQRSCIQESPKWLQILVWGASSTKGKGLRSRAFVGTIFENQFKEVLSSFFMKTFIKTPFSVQKSQSDRSTIQWAYQITLQHNERSDRMPLFLLQNHFCIDK